MMPPAEAVTFVVPPERVMFVLNAADAAKMVRPGIVVPVELVRVSAPRGVPSVPILPAREISPLPALTERFCAPVIVLEKLTFPLEELMVRGPARATAPVKLTVPGVLVKMLTGDGGAVALPKVIVLPVTMRLARLVKPPMLSDRVTGFAPAFSVRPKAPLIVFVKLKVLVVVMTDAPVRVIGWVIATEAAEMLLPMITLFPDETVRTLIGPLTPPPMTPPKVTVPVPAARVKLSAVMVLLSTVLVNVISAPVPPLLSVIGAERVTGPCTLMGLLFVEMFAPSEIVDPMIVKLLRGVILPIAAV